ncbi:MAG: N-acetylmuramoyl-L-alanine amidase, partial [Bacteroidales bacterium]|nr:N-acetylmuramoyl-L-alanine amidase [Bacteroidales bacterium]
MRNRIFTLMLCLSLLPVFSPGVYAGPIRTIVIDPGHGGNDPGAIGATGSHESEVVLDVALRLGALIRKNHPDVKVIYTRSTDVFIELYRRAEIANKNKADLFISIHCNSAPNATPYGAETFVMGVDKTNANMAVVQKENAAILKETDYQNNYEGFDPYSPESYIIFSLLQNAHLTKSTHFASRVQKYFVNDLHRLDRGVKQAPFLVL